MASKWPARIAGGAAGLANGLFGGGGGMVFLPILSRWGNLKSRQLYATCVAVIFPVCAVSAAMYLWRGGMDWRRGGSRYFSSKLWQSVHLISVGLAS